MIYNIYNMYIYIYMCSIYVLVLPFFALILMLNAHFKKEKVGYYY